jgi:hypothetical protein
LWKQNALHGKMQQGRTGSLDLFHGSGAVQDSGAEMA